MTIQKADPHDVLEQEDGEQMFREEFEALALRRLPDVIPMPEKVIPVGHATYEYTVRHMLERRTSLDASE